MSDPNTQPPNQWVPLPPDDLPIAPLDAPAAPGSSSGATQNASSNETFFEFRLEVFNLTNTPNFAQPGNLTFTNTNTFASISATRDNPDDPRELQFSLKYYF